ncbi:hypothetical protein [Sphingobium cloacae]|uniref:Regulatory protein n=1 Tax=Sphingobium cloacae TaxID=120107 RepID=A0A1E1F5Y6_9SPHN|nr:hypothetical protein [Sphingobium cloacae]BAV65919.1 regulatory protein [Sphingobium cloacae]
MNPALSISLLWLLAMLGAAAHMTPARLARADWARALAAYASAFWIATILSPQPNWIGLLIGTAAFWRLIAGPAGRSGSVVAGGSAALAAALQMAGGVPLWIAAALGLAALCAAGLARGGAGEGGVALREHVLVVVALASPAIGLAADAAYGWQSAVMLNRTVQPAAVPAPPVWAIAILVLAGAAGVIRGFWVRR